MLDIPEHISAQNHRRITTECYRLDRHQLDRIRNDSPLAWWTRRIHHWMHETLCGVDSPHRLRLTRHWRERCREYENVPSRDGTYVELLPHERHLLERLPEALHTSRIPGGNDKENGRAIEWTAELVEVGLNADGDVCKVALVLPLASWFPEGGGRRLFLMIGVDGGAKSFYVIPRDKYREEYRSRDGDVAYLTLEQVQLQFASLS